MSSAGAGRYPEFGLADLLARCEAVEHCLEWRRRAIEGRYPVTRIRGRHWYVRRLVWMLTRERAPKRGLDVCAGCGNPLCVHPDHLEMRVPASRTRGEPKSERHRRMTALAMRKRSTLTEDDVRAIRESEASNAEIDAQYGLFEGHALRIRTGRLWRDYSSPFAGLGAS